MDSFAARPGRAAALVLATLVSIAVPAAAASPEIEKARAAYDNLRYEKVLPLLERALANTTDGQELVEIEKPRAAEAIDAQPATEAAEVDSTQRADATAPALYGEYEIPTEIDLIEMTISDPDLSRSRQRIIL